MKKRVLNQLWKSLYTILGGSGLALATAGLAPSAVSAAALIWNNTAPTPGGANPGPNSWTAGQFPTLNSAINFFTVEQVFPSTGTFNGIRIRIRATPLATVNSTSNSPGILSATNNPSDPNLFPGQDRFNNLTDNGGASGGAAPQSSLSIGWTGTDLANAIRIDVIYEDANGNPIAVEDADIAIIDVDTQADNDWQDVVAFFGYNQATPVLPGTPSATNALLPSLSTTPPPTITIIPPPITPAYTISGNTVSGIPNTEAPNSGPNGNVFATYPTAITQARFDYTYGPASTSPTPHGIGIYNVFFTPVLIGAAKDVATPVANSDGTFTITYTVVVENLGETDLLNVQATEDLTATFANAQAFSVTDIRLVGTTGTGTPAPAINPNFNGTTDINLLDGAGTLSGRVVDNSNNAILTEGGTATLEFDVNVTPGTGPDGFGPFSNQVNVEGVSPNGTLVTDASTAGASSDGDGDGSPVDDTPTVLSLTPQSEIGLAKAISTPTAVAGQPGVFEFDITYVVTNTGGQPLDNVQLTDDLQEILIDNPTADGADGFSVESISVDSFTGSGIAPTANPAYDGDTIQELFTTDPNLFNFGDTATVTVTVQVDLSSDGVLDTQNSANVVGTDPSGAQVDDTSQSGSNVDPDGDGDPTNNSDPSPIQIGGAPEIGLAKAISTPTAVAGQPDVFDFDIAYIVTNTGGEPLDMVQLTDNLQAILIENPTTNGADSFTVQSVTVDSFTGSGIAPTANPAYDGNTVQELFTTDPNLFNVGDTATVIVTVRVDLSSDGMLDTQNSATATGVDPSGDIVSDVSQSGSNVDPDSDGDPTNNSEPSPIAINADASLVLVKRITNIFRQGIQLAVQGITGFNDQPTDPNDTVLQDAFVAAGVVNQPAGIFEFPSGFELQPGDQVEYTIYFLNDGGVAIDSVSICDELQPPSVLINTSFALQAVGATAISPTFADPVGTLIQPRTPLEPIDGNADPLELSCISNPGAFPSGPPGPANAGGGVVAGPFTLPPNQYGAVQFQITLP